MESNQEMRNSLGQFTKGNIPWLKGKEQTDEIKEKMRKSHLGMKLSKSHKQAISKANILRYQNPLEREKTSESMKGRIMPEETKQKMSIIKLKYWKNQRENPRCRGCKAKLTDKNWLPSDKKSGHYRCASCEKKRGQARIRQMRDYRRKHIVRSLNGKYLKGNKRPWTPICEMCGRKPKMLGYHHWDDDDLSKGVWVCGPCHIRIETIDNPEFVKKWRDLKARINKEKITLDKVSHVV